ncbi:MAG: DUF1016 family protein [Bacilli bacterium]|nr:DUF1016 family protein [Bacilli bacterium]
MIDIHLNNIKSLIDRNIVYEHKTNILKERNKVNTYFNIGKEIVDAIGERSEYGKGLLKTYSKELTTIYGKGYDYTNLNRMRKFYILFEKVASVRQQLSWTHIKTILPIKEDGKRNYYINLVIKNGLSVTELQEAIRNNSYERLTNKDKINIKIIENNDYNLSILDMIKDPIIINCSYKELDKYSEKALREIILEDIEKTLLELGIGFCYVGKEKRIKVGDNYRFIDLVFFNYELNCFVLFELKINKLDIRDIGQIEFYINYYDDEIKKDIHNDTIGIIICKKNDKEVMKYNKNSSIFATSYKFKVGD